LKFAGSERKVFAGKKNLKEKKTFGRQSGNPEKGFSANGF